MVRDQLQRNKRLKVKKKEQDKRKTHENKCGLSMSAGRLCTAFPSSHSQPRTTSSLALRSRSANTPNVRVSSSESVLSLFFFFPLSLLSFFTLSVLSFSDDSLALDSSFALRHSKGLNTAFGRHPLRAKRPSSPTTLASRAMSSGGPIRCTNGLGMPRWAYALSGSAR